MLPVHSGLPVSTLSSGERREQYQPNALFSASVARMCPPSMRWLGGHQVRARAGKPAVVWQRLSGCCRIRARQNDSVYVSYVAVGLSRRQCTREAAVASAKPR